MKKIIAVLLCVVSLGSFASDYSYDVTGEDENGNSVEFNGQWNGHGQISGETEDGLSVDLSTN